MKARTVIAPLVLAAVLTGGYFIDRARAQQQSLLSGYFESQPTQVSSRLGGRVLQILVKEGQVLKAGQPMLKFEASSSEAGYQGQLQAAEQANQQFLETKRGSRPEDIAKQEGVVREAQAALDRLTNGPLPEEIQTARDKLDEATALYHKVRTGSRPEEIASARAAAGQALQKYKQSQRGLTKEERAELKAHVDSAVAAESLALKQLNRSKFLYANGAVAKQELDKDQAAYDQATAAHRDAQQAYRRAQEGTPPEELAQAREAYNQAEAQLLLVLHGNRKEDIEAARREMLVANESLKLLVRGSRTEDIQAARARLDQAQAALLELQHGSRPEEIAKAKAAAKQAALQAKSTQDNVKERMVFAANDGVVDRILVADGDLVAAGSPVIQVGNPADIWLRVYLPEVDLPKVKVGDVADLVFDGIPGTVDGVVESIATNGEFTPANLQSPDERAKQVFGIRIRLAKPDSRVKAGMYATVKKVGSWP